MKPCRVEVEGVKAGYRNTVVLQVDSLRIEEGSVVAVLGPNGSGKTTLLRLLAGLVRPFTGRVVVCGSDPRRARHVISYAPATPEIDPRLRALEVALLYRYGISKGIGWGRSDWEEAARALEDVGVGGLARRLWAELSSGQRRLVILAAAMTRRAGLLLLDEPHSFLDVTNKRIITRAIHRLRGKATIVYTTHDPLPAMTADKVVVLKDGGIHSIGPPRDVITVEMVEEVYNVPASRHGDVVLPEYFKP